MQENKDPEQKYTQSKSEFKCDPLLPNVAEFIVSKQKFTTELVQRGFKIGYNRAMRIFQQLEELEIVGNYKQNGETIIYFQDKDLLDKHLSKYSLVFVENKPKTKAKKSLWQRIFS